MERLGGLLRVTIWVHENATSRKPRLTPPLVARPRARALMHWQRLDHDCRDENAFRRLRVLAAGADRLRVPFLQGGKNGQGPNLWGLIGRSSGSVDGFAYSAANKNSGITWSAKHLEVYLQDPKKVTPQPRSALVLSCGSVVWGSHGTQEAFMAGRGSNRRCCEDPTPYSHQE